MTSRRRRFVHRSMTIAFLILGGCSAYGPDDRQEEYFYLVDGTYYPVEDGLPYDADVTRYTHRQRYYYMERPNPFDPGVGSVHDRHR